MRLICPTCENQMDIRNQQVGFCIGCATHVDLITGAAYNKDGQFIKNVISEMISATCYCDGFIVKPHLPKMGCGI